MSKDYDGGISTGKLGELSAKLADLQTGLSALIGALLLEENQSSLVDQDLVKGTPGKCEAIKTKRKAVEDLIGSASDQTGVAHALVLCGKSIVPLITAATALKNTYEGVTVQPTGGPGHC